MYFRTCAVIKFASFSKADTSLAAEQLNWKATIKFKEFISILIKEEQLA